MSRESAREEVVRELHRKALAYKAMAVSAKRVVPLWADEYNELGAEFAQAAKILESEGWG